MEAARRQLAGRRVQIQPRPEVRSIEGLPAGIQLGPGRLEITFSGTEDLLKHQTSLIVLAKSV